mgnify:FL=1
MQFYDGWIKVCFVSRIYIFHFLSADLRCDATSITSLQKGFSILLKRLDEGELLVHLLLVGELQTPSYKIK